MKKLLFIPLLLTAFAFVTGYTYTKDQLMDPAALAKVLNDAEIITVLAREAKKRREAVDAYTEAKREDLANKEKAEGVIIAQYLPEQLSEAELKKMIADAIAETNAAGPAGMGLVMKVLQPKIAGKADGGLVSGLVKAALAQ